MKKQPDKIERKRPDVAAKQLLRIRKPTVFRTFPLRKPTVFRTFP